MDSFPFSAHFTIYFGVTFLTLGDYNNSMTES